MAETIINFLFFKVGVININILLLWFIFFICFVCGYYSYISFNKSCAVGYAIVTYYDNSSGGTGRAYVRLLEADDDSSYGCKTFDYTEKDKPVGSKVKVAYKKNARGYEIRGIESRGKNAIIVMFVLQLIIIIAFFCLNAYSMFINPSFHMI